MGALKDIQEIFQREAKGEKGEAYDYKAIQRQRLMRFRKEKNSIVRVEKPTNIARARTLGYKAKKGIMVARVRIRKGTGKHRRPKGGRRPKRMGVKRLSRNLSVQGIAEQRAARRFKNCEVLNSYHVGDDGKSHYFEVILVDPAAPEIQSDSDLNWVCSGKARGRAFHGKTSSGRKARGLRKRGKSIGKKKKKGR